MLDAVKRSARLFFSVPGLVIFGLALRTYHYARNPSMWHDEAVLVLNVLHKDFVQLWGKLDFAEAAPPLFLCLERLVVLALGDSTFALRLVPFLSSCGALLLFARIAPRIVNAAAVPWAVLLVAASDHLLWHTCEAKPYSTDVFVAVFLLSMFVTTETWTPARRALFFALVAPGVIFISFPGVFLIGAVLAALLPPALRQRWSARLAYVGLVVVVGVSFVMLLLGPVRAQRCPEMDSCWEGCFATLDRPLALPGWACYNTAQICRYCCEPVGNVLTILAGIGAWSMARRRPALLALLVVPCALALAASFLHAYPYTAARVLVYTTPAWVLLIAEGTSVAFGERRGVSPPWTSYRQLLVRIAGAIVVVLLLVAPCYALFHVIAPQPRTECGTAADFVLDRIQHDEAVTSNAPESRYYLRGSDAFVVPDEVAAVDVSRIWLIGTGRTESDRLACLQTLPSGTWRCTRERDYTLTTIYRLERQP